MQNKKHFQQLESFTVLFWAELLGSATHEQIDKVATLTKSKPEDVVAQKVPLDKFVIKDLLRVLNREHGNRVFKAYRRCKRVSNRITRDNVGLIGKCAGSRRFSGELEFEDLMQEGAFGLMVAVHRFDWRRGTQFSTYAYHWIKHCINRAISNKADTIRIPVGSQKMTVADCRPRVVNQHTKRHLDKVVTVWDYVKETMPKDQQNSNDQVYEEQLKGQLLRAFGLLPPRAQHILCQHFEHDRSLEDIGKELDLSRERVRQLKNEHLHQLRRSLKLASVENPFRS